VVGRGIREEEKGVNRKGKRMEEGRGKRFKRDDDGREEGV